LLKLNPVVTEVETAMGKHGWVQMPELIRGGIERQLFNWKNLVMKATAALDGTELVGELPKIKDKSGGAACVCVCVP
jgi:hypothetical protein